MSTLDGRSAELLVTGHPWSEFEAWLWATPDGLPDLASGIEPVAFGINEEEETA